MSGRARTWPETEGRTVVAQDVSPNDIEARKLTSRTRDISVLSIGETLQFREQRSHVADIRAHRSLSILCIGLVHRDLRGQVFRTGGLPLETCIGDTRRVRRVVQVLPPSLKLAVQNGDNDAERDNCAYKARDAHISRNRCQHFINPEVVRGGLRGWHRG